jgi:uncharacterized Zn ribbon protein
LPLKIKKKIQNIKIGEKIKKIKLKEIYASRNRNHDNNFFLTKHMEYIDRM